MPELTYREAVRDALSKALREDENVFLMGRTSPRWAARWP